jgi:hypothetical protein
MLAFTMNRTGDMVLSIGFFAIFGLFGTLNYETIFALAPNSNELAITIISLLLIGGSLAKSAQIPLHSWLPGSMEARLLLKYLSVFILFTCIYILFMEEGKGEIINFIYCLNLPLNSEYNLRDAKGRFRSPTKEELKPVIPLLPDVINPLIGNLLGDGSLLINKKNSEGLPKPTANANFVMTLKNKEYIYHLCLNIYASICSKTVLLLDLILKQGYLFLNIILSQGHFPH